MQWPIAYPSQQEGRLGHLLESKVDVWFFAREDLCDEYDSTLR